MSDFSPNVRLVGLKDPARVDTNISLSLVDVACAAGMGPTSVDIFVDEADTGTDLHNPEDRAWFTEILQQVLASCGETEGEVVFLSNHPPKGTVAR